MTDFRHGNDVGFMQQQQQQQYQQQPQQQSHHQKSKTALRESFHTKCNINSTSETLQLSPKKQYQLEQQQQHQQQQQNPLLQSLIDYTYSLTAQSGNVSTIGQHYNENAAGIPPTDGIQFDEHEIYYLSPTKRKSSFRSTISGTVPIQQQQQQQRFTISSPVSNMIYCNQIASTVIPTTSGAAVAAAPRTILTTTTTSDYGARLAGVVHDFSLDDTSSHYSDTAMQVLRSGSGTSGSLGDNNCRFQNFGLSTTATTMKNNNNNNNKCHSHSSSSSSLATTARNANMIRFSEQHHQYHGSLQRNKGRSTQSLCSCDAGNDTEINFDSTRPLYQYDVGGKRTHTYTCEQNAQILMRLERERKRKFSLGTDVEIGLGNTMTVTTTGRAKNDMQVNKESIRCHKK